MSTLYVSDLDGTLLRSDSTLSPFSREGLAHLLHSGVLFTVASARSVVSMRQILGDLPLELPVIGFNGGHISRYTSGEHLRIAHIDRRVASWIGDRVLGAGLSPFVSVSGAGEHLYYQEVVNAGMAWFLRDRLEARDPRLKQVADIRAACGEHVICMTVIGQPAQLEVLRAEIGAEVGGAVRPQLYGKQGAGWCWLSLYGPDATKARGLELLRMDPEFELPGRHRLVVFGDELNDLEMFALADHAVAVAGAVAPLKDVADEVIGENDADSVVKWILDREG